MLWKKNKNRDFTEENGYLYFNGKKPTASNSISFDAMLDADSGFCIKPDGRTRVCVRKVQLDEGRKGYHIITKRLLGYKNICVQNCTLSTTALIHVFRIIKSIETGTHPDDLDF